MNPVSKIVVALRDIRNHPVNRSHKNKAVLKYGFVQVAARLVPGDVCVDFPNGTRLLVPPLMKGAAHYISPGLCEFEDMAFVMHYLRRNDLFVDIGANIGAFTVLASGAAGCQTVAFEAAPDTFEALSRNIRLNGLQDRVTAVMAAAAQKEGETYFTSGLGTENYIDPSHNGNSGTKVKMTTVDVQLAGKSPDVLKVDVEGFETEVFAGAVNTLKSPKLQAILIEKDGLGARYGFDEEPLHRNIEQHGFVPCTYQPFSRQLVPGKDEGLRNIIYTRDIKAANEKLRSATPFKLGDLSV